MICMTTETKTKKKKVNLDRKYEDNLIRTDSMHLLFEITKNLVERFEPVYYNGCLYLRSKKTKKYTY